jgi:serine/threonine protein kinase
MTNLIGHSLGRYHILEKLGEGGMAVVYKAYDTRLDIHVAVKVIRTENILPSALDRTLKRFEREAKALARLTHSNIVKVTDYGEYEGKPYLVMPLLSGGNLKNKLNGNPMPWQDAMQMLIPIADALGYAHKHDIIHRDVKPANILITENGQPMLADFGVAKMLDVEETMDLTGTGVGIGTPEYMAPEQGSSKSIDHRVDIYALGVVLFEMVTGRKPYMADTPLAVLIKRASEPLPSPRQFVENLPQAVENIVLKALAKDPKDRYQNMDDFAKPLKGLSSEKASVKKVAAPKPNEIPVSKPHAEFKPPLFLRKAAIIVGVIVLGTGLVAMTLPLMKSLSALLFPTAVPVLTSTPGNTLTPILAPDAIITPSISPTPILGVGSKQIRPTDGMTMMFVPEGSFVMGAAKSYTDESPPHTVYLNSFWIDNIEATATIYKQCESDGVCPPYSKEATSQNGGHATNISWSAANDYCKWAGGRLPTEAEWEKAARGGLEGKKYPWGDELPLCASGVFNGALFSSCGNYPDDSVYFSQKNGYGLYGMAGGVWEWVSDWYGANYYSNSPQNNPTGPADGKMRVLRGGSYGSPAEDIRVALRHNDYPYQANGDMGFRCALSAFEVGASLNTPKTQSASQAASFSTSTIQPDIPMIKYGETVSFTDNINHKLGFIGKQGEVVSLMVWGGSIDPKLVVNMKPFLTLIDMDGKTIIDKSGSGQISILNYALPYTGGYNVQMRVDNTRYYEFTLRLEKP